ncbi:hypothetical protein EN12_23235 [Vibrio cholerae]|nr:hypothetical protein EN12_23235 [Vibrio cholerae]
MQIMSTPIKTVKNIATLAKFIVSSMNSSDHVFKNSTRTQMEKAGFLKDGEFLTPENINEIEVKLFKSIAMSNLESHLDMYLGKGIDQEIKRNFESQEKSINLVASKMDKLKSLSLDESPRNVAMVCALTDDIIHGLDQETTLRTMLIEFQESCSKYAVKIQPEYESIPDNLSIQDVSRSFISAASGAYLRLGFSGVWRSLMSELEAVGSYSDSSNSYRTFYGDEVLASMVIDHMEGKVPEVLFLNQVCYPDRLPDFKSQTGLKISIASDVPKPTESDFYVVAKILNEIRDKFQSKEWQDKFEDKASVKFMARKLDKLALSYSEKLIRESEPYTSYYRKSIEKHRELSL